MVPGPSGISPACRASVRAVGGRPVSPRMLGPSRERVRGGCWVILSTRGSSQQTRAPPLGADERGQRAQPVHTPHTPEPWLPGALRFTHTDARRRGTCTDLPDTGARDAHSTHVCTHNTAHMCMPKTCAHTRTHMHTQHTRTHTHHRHMCTWARSGSATLLVAQVLGSGLAASPAAPTVCSPLEDKVLKLLKT